MTFSLEENSPATVFQKTLKSSADEMILPELIEISINSKRSSSKGPYYLP